MQVECAVCIETAKVRSQPSVLIIPFVQEGFVWKFFVMHTTKFRAVFELVSLRLDLIYLLRVLKIAFLLVSGH